ncbi:MAG: hypothetical protein ISR65_15425 [Bacteriovoracaceae bacterium]|nr:hypothetical protein [Bacteriovoracaceae bacterium]
MKIFIFTLISIFILFHSTNTTASLDYSLNLEMRSYPSLGGNINFDAGYNYLFWGDNADIWYGLIRPSINFKSSLLLNGLEAKLEVYPISLLGIAVGYKWSDVNTDFSFFDCGNSVYCQGQLTRGYITAKTGYAIDGFFLTAKANFEKLTFSKTDKKFADYIYALEGNNAKDYLGKLEITTGKVFSNYTIGLIGEFATMRLNKSLYRSYYLFIKKPIRKYSVIVGGGSFQSDIQPIGAIIFINLSYIWAPNKKLL